MAVGSMSQAQTSWAAPTMTIRAVFDDSEAQTRMRRFNRRVKETERVMQSYSQQSEASASRTAAASQKSQQAQTRATEATKKGAKSSADASEKSNRRQMMGLRSLRWEVVTIMFFMKLFEKVITAAWERIGEVTEEHATGKAIRALAGIYAQSSKEIVDSLRGVASGTITTAQASKLAQGALLADQGQFTSEYTRLWESARIAAVVSGTDAAKAFTSMIQALAEGRPELADAAAPVLRLEEALTRYALQSGRTVDALGEQERQHVMLQEIYARTQELIAAGAEGALEATAPIERLTKSWKDFTAVLATSIEVTGALEAATKTVRAAAQAWAILMSAQAAYAQFQLHIAAQLVTGTLDLGRAFEGATQAGLEAFKRMSEGMGIIWEDSKKLAGASANVNRMVDKLLEARMRAAELAGAGIERALDAVANYQRRSERLAAQYNRRIRRMERDKVRDIDRINRRSNISRDRAIRNYNQRREQQEREHHNRIAEAQERHALQMRHSQERFHVQSIIDEQMYRFERGLLVASGDVLAIEELDERYRLEQDARKRNFELQKRQAEEMFQLQLKYMKMAWEGQLDGLKEALQDQLDEIETRRQEEINEREQRHREQLEEAGDSYKDQQQGLKDALQDQLTAIGRGLQKQAEKWREGYGIITDLIRQAMGPGGNADAIMAGFLQRYRDITIRLQTYVATGTWPGAGSRQRPGRQPGGRSPGGGGPQQYQYGGDFITTGPTEIIVGEHGTERVTVTPMAPNVGAMSLSWTGGAIPIHGTGEMAGADLSGLGDAIAEGLMVELGSQILRQRGYYGT